MRCRSLYRVQLGFHERSLFIASTEGSGEGRDRDEEERIICRTV